MVKAEELRDLIAAHPEWLLVRETGRTFPLFAGEIDVTADGDKVHFGFIDDKGLHTWRLNAYARESGELSIDAAGVFARKREVMRLVPRISAAELSPIVKAARIQKA